jgi:Flp pilus assembly protein TadD
MTTDLLDWHEEDQSVDPEAEYRMLLNGLCRTEGFGLFFVQCSPFGGEQIIQWVRSDLVDQTISVLKLADPIEDGNVFKRIRDFLDTQPKTQVLFIQGLELSLLDYEESKKRLGWSSEKIFSYSWQGVPPVLINLNQQRERFRDSFHTRLVFLLPIFAIKYLVHRAPDFFDWRSGVAQLTDDADTLSRESQRIWQEGDYQQYLSWTQAQRNHRILEMQSLLEAQGLGTQEQCSLHFKQGNLFAASTEWEAAIAAYDAALAIKPDYHEALNNKGVALVNLGRYEAAISAYDAALAIKPDYHEALYNKGVALGNLGRYEAAISAYDAALAIKPDDPEALNNKGVTLGNLGRYEAAIAAYDAALAIKPDDPVALNNKGVTLGNLDRYEAAIAAYDAALAIKPDDPGALYNKACIYGLQGKVEPTLENLATAIQLNPDKCREMATTDSDFDAIRHDPRFQTLLTERLE